MTDFHTAPVPDPSPAEPRDAIGFPGMTMRWLLLVVPLAMVTGSAVALFLWALDGVTALRIARPTLLWFLPATGALVGYLYARGGRGVDRGSNLILDEIHEPAEGVTARLAPLVLLGTLLTHLCGGSAGREGTAVQMGGSIAGAFEHHVLARVRRLRPLAPVERGMLLQAGMAAGFGAVFGTPFAGAVFAIEVLRVGRLAPRALLPSLIAALLADQVTRAWGIRHTSYPHVGVAGEWFTISIIGKVVLAAILFGLASRLFAFSVHAITAMFARLFGHAWQRPFVGGVAIIALTYLAGTNDYLGLGVSSPESGTVTILSAFAAGGAEPWSWLLKLLFTAVTIGTGFKGGEVTPLFFIGATLGNTLAMLLGAPTELFAALGLVAVFAGATNTPIACTILGLELFGYGSLPYLAAACGMSFLVSGPAGVYSAQRRFRTESTPAKPSTSSEVVR